MNKKVIIDCTPKPDDILTLLFATKSNNLDILGITLHNEDDLIMKFAKYFNIPVHIEDSPDFIVSTLKENTNVSIISFDKPSHIEMAFKIDKDAFTNLDEFITLNYTHNIPINSHNVITDGILLTMNLLYEFDELCSDDLYNFIKGSLMSYIDSSNVVGCMLYSLSAIAYYLNYKSFSEHTTENNTHLNQEDAQTILEMFVERVMNCKMNLYDFELNTAAELGLNITPKPGNTYKEIYEEEIRLMKKEVDNSKCTDKQIYQLYLGSRLNSKHSWIEMEEQRYNYPLIKMRLDI